MKKIVSLTLALALVAALGIVAMADTRDDDDLTPYLGYSGKYASQIGDDEDPASDDFVAGTVVAETTAAATEANPGTGLHFGF